MRVCCGLKGYGELTFRQRFKYLDGMIINRLPSKKELDKRKIIHIVIDLMCVSYFAVEKDLFHLSFSCSFAAKVWESICEWLEMKIFVENSILNYAKKFYHLWEVNLLIVRRYWFDRRCVGVCGYKETTLFSTMWERI